MELQGKKTTHDFLSLCNDSSSFQRHDPRPPPPSAPSGQQVAGNFSLKTHDFFGGGRAAGEVRPAPPRAAPDINLAASAAERAPPGGVITYASVSHVHGLPSTVAVKPECPTSPVAASWPQETATPTTVAAVAASARRVGGVVASQSSRASYGNMGHSGGGAFTLWEEQPPLPKGIKGESVAQHQQGWPWPSPYGSRSGTSSFPSRSPSRNQKCLVMDSASKSSKGYTDDEDDEDYSLNMEGYLHKELSVKVDGKSTGDQKPSTPRSKHSATEQRRRSKINDRFQILRKLIPHSDQKRDKASFLLEVIEYIQFLQEKVHKYESNYPMWSHENTNMMPWVKVFFRSLWENARKNSQGHLEGIADPSRVIGNGRSPSSYVVCGDTIEASAPMDLGCNQAQTESENVTSGLSSKTNTAHVHLSPCGTSDSFTLHQQRLVSESDNVTYQSQSHCMRPNSGPGSDMLDGQELTIDEGTISISSAYSQGVLQSLTQALQSSGIDLSLANISVQINLGRQAFGRSGTCSKNQEDPPFLNQALGPLRVGSSGLEESQHANKRHKVDKC